MKKVIMEFAAFKMIQVPMLITEEQYQEMLETNNCKIIEKVIDRVLPQDMHFDNSCTVYDPETKGYILEW